MFNRKIYEWDVQLLAPETGQTREVKLRAYWDPASVTGESVANTAAAQETVAGQYKPRFVGISARLAAA